MEEKREGLSDLDSYCSYICIISLKITDKLNNKR